jgi:spermidine synthase
VRAIVAAALDGAAPLPQASASAVGSARLAAGTRSGRFAVLAVLFVLSGASGLVAQLCFSKYLGYIVGSTAHAVSAVLAAFMTGLALGAQIGGRRSASLQRPLIAYGVLELVVAASVASTPLAFAALTPLYVSLAGRAPDSLTTLSALRWSAAMALVIVPTTAMGATLPLLARALGTTERLGKERRLGWLYAANTLGGAMGALLAAYLVLPALGLRKTLLATAALSACVGVAAVVLGRREREPPPAAAMGTGQRSPLGLGRSELGRLGALALLSGWLVFASEVVFVHLLALVIGSSAYAFGLILAVFLSCLFIGASRSLAFGRWLGDAALSWGLVGAGVALALTLPLWDELPLLFTLTGASVSSFAGREALRALAAFGVLCVPVTAMGLTFPLLLQRVARYENVGRLVGRLTAVNTIGAVIGSLVTGYVVLPWLGSQRALLFTALAFVVAGMLSAGKTPLLKPKLLACVGLGAVAAAFAPRWDLARLTSGSNVYFDGGMPPDQILMMEEDVHGGVTTVTRSQGVTTLLTNGKFQGNDGWEMDAQRLFAHYPSLFVERWDRALVIGLGTGTTLGTLAAYPWQNLDVVEISPAIVQAARRYFLAQNQGALDDPRVNLTLADGRNHLLIVDRRYDLIGIELSSIWFAGAASLYSREFYALVHRRLRPGGIFQQWVQLHHITPTDFASVLGTLRAEFPHVALFFGGGQGVLVASDRPLSASAARLASLEQRPRVRAVLPPGKRLISLLDDVLVVGAGLDRFVAESARAAGVTPSEMISTDDNLSLEFSTPRGNVLPWSTLDDLVARLLHHRDQQAVERLRAP